MANTILGFDINTCTIYNCNARLSSMYKERDNISHRIDTLISHGYDPSSAEKEYDELCDIIADHCVFRRSHPGCLIEGDPGYCLN